MAKRNTIIGVAAAAAVGFMMYKGWSVKRAVKMLDYSISNVAIRFSGITPVLYFKLIVYNPNSQAIPASDIVGQVYYRGFDVAVFQNKTPVNIGAQQKASFDMQARIRPGEILQALLKKEPGASVTIEGLLRTSVVDMPFTYKWNFAQKS